METPRLQVLEPEAQMAFAASTILSSEKPHGPFYYFVALLLDRQSFVARHSQNPSLPPLLPPWQEPPVSAFPWVCVDPSPSEERAFVEHNPMHAA
jgi:hypothetical protein